MAVNERAPVLPDAPGISAKMTEEITSGEDGSVPKEGAVGGNDSRLHKPLPAVGGPYEEMDDASSNGTDSEEEDDDYYDDDSSDDDDWLMFREKEKSWDDEDDDDDFKEEIVTTVYHWPAPPTTKRSAPKPPLQAPPKMPIKATLKRPLSDENKEQSVKLEAGASVSSVHGPSPPAPKSARTTWRTFSANGNRKVPGERIVDEVELLSNHPPSPSWNSGKISGNKSLGSDQKDKESFERCVADEWSYFSHDLPPPAIKTTVVPVKRVGANLEQMSKLRDQLDDILSTRPSGSKLKEGDANSPVPKFWVSKWIDYTEKYGVAYQLCGGSVGVFFNDWSHMTLLDDGKNVIYVDHWQYEFRRTLAKTPPWPPYMKDKLRLLEYFSAFMRQRLLRTGGSGGRRTVKERARPPHLVSWLRTHSTIAFHLSDNTVQVNFLQDHSKIILCPLMDTISYIDRNREFSVYRTESLLKADLAMDLVSRLRYSREVVKKLALPVDPRAALSRAPFRFSTSTPVAVCQKLLGAPGHFYNSVSPRDDMRQMLRAIPANPAP
ncbi:serine/threonine-protein kinase plo1 [Ixodes scapularis]|uniref:serine/threonine-protein kinase plo1 n=1 Tax=Ixodes scapularis TaxID=6945 RepID=UPI001A9EF4DA|nr:serine/threonine-protein kinase plo1 [Ixodes scapularis]